METAGNDQFDDDTEKKGLGTPATRAGIIEKLVKSGFAERKGKSLIPTKDGCNLVCVLPEQITSPAMTAEWENMSGIGKFYNKMQVFQKWFCRIVAVVFIFVGIYYGLMMYNLIGCLFVDVCSRKLRTSAFIRLCGCAGAVL